MPLGLEAWNGLPGWTAGPGLGRLGQAGVGTGLEVQALVAVAVPQTGTVGASTVVAVGGAGVAAVEHTLKREKPDYTA